MLILLERSHDYAFNEPGVLVVLFDQATEYPADLVAEATALGSAHE
jgi:hypothetical protein